MALPPLKAPIKMESPATKSFAIVKDDTNDMAISTRAIFVGTGGDLSLILVDDTTPQTYKNVPSGTLFPFCVKRVLLATTAADLVGLY